MFRLFHSYNSVGGPVKVNNMLSTLNIPIGEKKCIERQANEKVEKVAGMSPQNTKKAAFEMEMQSG